MFTKAENMTSAAVSQFYDVGLVLQNKLNQLPPMERRNTVSTPVNRNFTIGNFSTVGLTPQANVIPMDNQTLQGLNKDHRKLDRSYSEPCDKMNNNLANLNNSSQQKQQQQQQQQQGAVNSSRYKTELCRPFEESGHCKYADKCQFAHGIQELKHLQRHPKYKTELCRTFHSKGFCPYGPRCNFIHNENNQKMNEKNNVVTVQAIQQQQATQYFQHISPPGLSQSPPPPAQRPSTIGFNSSFSGSMGSVSDSSPPSSVSSGSPSLSPVFFGEEAPVMNSCYNVPINNSLNYDNSTNTVFNSLSELATMGPLNVQTQLTNRDLAAFTQNFSKMLNLNSQCNSGSGEEWDTSLFGQIPPSSPDSISGESVSSTNSFASSNTYSSCGSPMDVGKNLRLPVFNMISQD